MSAKKKAFGFSLIELSTSIAIIAMIAGSAISIALTSDYPSKLGETNAKLDRIEEALTGFLTLNHRLPCPADGTLATSDSNFGSEGMRSSTSCPLANFSDGGNVTAGVVPVRTLQLPDDFMFDGWGHRITYAIDYRFANNTTTNPACNGNSGDLCFIGIDSGGLTVTDASGGNRTTSAIYILLSHGENGHGAFNKVGSATRIRAHYPSPPYPYTNVSAEVQNSHFDVSGNTTPYNNIFIQKDYIKSKGGEYFDNILRFKDKTQLVLTTGTYFYNSNCTDASNIINNPSNNACTGAATESDCDNYATEVYNLCLQ